MGQATIFSFTQEYHQFVGGLVKNSECCRIKSSNTPFNWEACTGLTRPKPGNKVKETVIDPQLMEGKGERAPEVNE